MFPKKRVKKCVIKRMQKKQRENKKKVLTYTHVNVPEIFITYLKYVCV